MRRRMRRSITVAAALAIGLGALTPASVRAAPQGWYNVSANGSALGKKFKDWSAEWWQFMLSLPVAESPIADTTGEKCVLGQRGPVWFLIGTFSDPVTRACTIPEGKALFFPVVTISDTNITSQTPDELRAEIGPCLDAVTLLSVTVDGKPVEKLAKARVKSSASELTFPSDGFLSAGTYSPVVADGYYVMLKPLPLGSHTLRIQAAGTGCPFIPFPFSQDATYNLTIVPVSLK